jgi:DNA modification methylase
MNYLYYGDNLAVLREHVADESVDLVYLDPPFNSNRSYNVLFKEVNGTSADAQIVAFDDTWSWGQMAEATLREIEQTAAPHIVEMIHAIVGFVGRNDVTAYLVMMTIRLIELHRVLKPTGSIYLHCDPTASHYLKVVMDTIFGKEQFVNEIVWKRTSTHADSRRWASVHDVLLFYSKTDDFLWNPTYMPHDKGYVERFYRHEDQRGVYRLDHIIRSASMGPRPNLAYEYKGYTPEWGWRTVREKLEALDGDDRLYWSSTGRPYLKRYLHEQKGTPITSVVTDIPPIGANAAERLGYPTQKPIELLERIILASSNEGDLVLDPFCGCGTTVCAAQKLGRRWIGIDITHLAIGLMRSRLRDMFGDEVEAAYQVVGVPADEASANALALQDRHEFEHWALGLIGARSANQGKKGADQGVDGVLYFDDEPKKRAKKVVVQVKSGQVHSSAIRDLGHVVEREQAAMGFLISLGPPTKPMDVEALAAGYYHSPTWNRDYPKIQIRTIAELQQGKGFHLPPANITHAQAQRVEPEGGQERLL